MRNIFKYSVLIVLLSVSFSLVFQSKVCATEKFYTVQTGTYGPIYSAKHYSALEESLAPKDRDFLRIEVVQNYHTVRLGKFVEKKDALALLDTVSALYPDSIMFHTNIEDERITKIYPPSGKELTVAKEAPAPLPQVSAKKKKSALAPVQKTKNSPPPVQKENSPPVKTKARKADEAQEFYTVQIGTYGPVYSVKHYSALEESLALKDRDFLRIEVVQNFHTVRLGKFVEKKDALALLDTVRELYPGALVLSAYVKDERITRIWGKKPARKMVVAEPKPLPSKSTPKSTPTPEAKKPVVEKDERKKTVKEQVLLPPVVEPKKIKRNFTKKIIAILTKDEQGKSLHYPSSVFVDSTSGEIFVVVGGGKKGGVVFGPDYLPAVSLGAGRDVVSSVGGFIDTNGNLYLCQQATGEKPARLSIFNAAFFLVKEITFTGLGEELSDFSPKQAAVSPVNGNIYLTGSVYGVAVLDANGTFLRWLAPEVGLGREGYRGTDKGPDYIVDVYIDSGGDLYLLSENSSSVYIYTPQEEFLHTIGEKGGVYGKLSRPQGVAADRNRGLVYVVDYLRHSVLVYDLSGTMLAELGGRGRAPGWFNFPTDLAVDKNHNLVIADFFNQRVQVWEVQEERASPK